MLVFAGTRSLDLMGIALRLAGFELRDTIGHAHADGGGAPLLAWTFGSGFPKSANISKMIDREAGVEREVVGRKVDPRYNSPATATSGAIMGNVDPRKNAAENYEKAGNLTAPATEDAKRWNGFGTALKPSFEPILLCRKPLAERTVAANVLAHGVGGINVDACRVEASDGKSARIGHAGKESPVHVFGPTRMHAEPDGKGRWPANLIHDGSDEVRACFPEMHGAGAAQEKQEKWANQSNKIYGKGVGSGPNGFRIGDSGSTARFFKQCTDDDPEDAATRLVCELCGLSSNGQRVMMSAKQGGEPCSKDAKSVTSSSNQTDGAMPSVSVLEDVPGSGQQDHEAKGERSFDSAAFAGRNFPVSQVTIGHAALQNVDEAFIRKIVQNVKCAGGLCDSCATAIARSLVAMQLGQDPESILGRVFTSGHKRQILKRCLASFVVLLGDTDTIPTTDSLNLLFGSVFHAIGSCTQRGEERRESVPCQKRLLYVSKASRADRNEGCEGLSKEDGVRAGNSHPT
jgi:hypothetical protein